MDDSLRDRKIAALKQMLNFNVPITKNSIHEVQWKILVYDRLGEDIIGPLLTVKELREMGVTLHLALHSPRDPIPDVPVVYFVYPSEDSIKAICKDIEGGLYENFYLNFISPISRQRLEEIAQSAIKADAAAQVLKVFDQYTNFICLESDLFILRNQNSDAISYQAINRGDIEEKEMDEITDQIVEGLYSVCVTQATVPIIRCPRGNAAEIVADKLDKKLRDNLRDARNCLFTSTGSSAMTGDSTLSGSQSLHFQRPLLLLLDRDMDLATPFHHTWTYQALVHDIFNLRQNQVVISAETKSESVLPAQKKKFSLSTVSDKFWRSHKGSPFPEVAEAVTQELNEVRAQQEQVNRLKAAMGAHENEIEVEGGFGNHSSALSATMSSVPEMLERKRNLDMHTSIATALADQIKARKLDLFFELEEKLLARQALQEKNLSDLMSDYDAGSPLDKLRLFLITILCEPQVVESDMDKYIRFIEEAHDRLRQSPEFSPLLTQPIQDFIPAIKYLKRIKLHSKMTQVSGAPTQSNLFSKWMSHGSAFLMEGVKNLVVKKHNLPFTRLVDALMDSKPNSEVDDFRYYDPKLLRANEAESQPKVKQSFQEAVVFVIGGGNYIEYQNLVDYKKTKATASSPKKITYGCTELLNAVQFLNQLANLGKA